MAHSVKHPLAPYLDPDDREILVERLAEQAGARVVVYGKSHEGRALRAVCIPAEQQQAPAVLCAANIHGPELIGGVIALELLRRLACPKKGVHLGLRQRAEVWIIPCLNPDGYARTWRSQGQGQLAALRPNARGVDLNRNFPLSGDARPSRWPGAGSSKPGALTFRGPAPLSEPETAHLEALLAKRAFHACLSFHSYMGTIIPARVQDHRSYRVYRALGQRFRQAQTRVRYLRLASRWLDVFTGELEDHLHHAHHCWAACVETFSVRASLAQHLRAPNVFWRFNPRDPRPWVDNDLPAVVAFFEAALEQGRP